MAASAGLRQRGSKGGASSAGAAAPAADAEQPTDAEKPAAKPEKPAATGPLTVVLELALVAACAVSLYWVSARDLKNSSSANAAAAWSAGFGCVALAAALGALRFGGVQAARAPHQAATDLAEGVGVALLATGGAWQNHNYKRERPEHMLLPCAAILTAFVLRLAAPASAKQPLRTFCVVGALYTVGRLLKTSLAELADKESSDESVQWIVGGFLALVCVMVVGYVGRPLFRAVKIYDVDVLHIALALLVLALGKAASSRCGVCGGGSGKLSIDLDDF